MWKGRKAAFAAMGRVSPNYIVQDGVIPRTTLPEVLREIGELSNRYGLRVANVFHAGDGNLHPLFLFDRRQPGALERVHAAAEEVLRVCLDAGGALSGEHGIGLEKRDYMPLLFSPDDLVAQDTLRAAFDPLRLFNPTKVIPSGSRCGDLQAVPAGVWV
jgi:glycolate oxidase